MFPSNKCLIYSLIAITLGLMTCNKGGVNEKNNSHKHQEAQPSSDIFKSHIEFLGINPADFESNTIVLPQDDSPFPKLSNYGFFKGPVHYLIPSDGVLPYSLNSELFSDYAYKARFVWMPQGSAAKYRKDEVLDFPLGTVLIKNFYYPIDMRNPHGDRRLIETRLLVNTQSGWKNYPYLWNEDQTEADYHPFGEFTKVSWIDIQGEEQHVNYMQPQQGQCKSCHIVDDKVMPIGPKVRNLNGVFDYGEEGKQNQLVYWQQMGYLEGFNPNEPQPRNAVWSNPSEDLDDRARAYLDINCGHCHNPKGPGNTTGFYLDALTADPKELGVCKVPVAAGRGSGNLRYDIVPGNPSESIVHYRMASEEIDVMMPEIGRSKVHYEGLELIASWIASMEEGSCNE